MASTGLIFLFTPIAAEQPAQMVLFTHFSTPVWDEQAQTLSFEILEAPAASGAISQYEAEFDGSRTVTIPVVTGQTYPYTQVINFNPTLYPNLWEYGVASWNCTIRLRARSSGWGAHSVPVDVEISQDSTLFFPDGDWTFSEERDTDLASGIDGKRKITLDAAATWHADYTPHVYGDGFPFSPEYAATLDDSIAPEIAVDETWLSTTGAALTTTQHGYLMLYHNDTGARILASSLRQFVVQGLIDETLPQPTADPSISGTGKIGGNLTASNGTWTGSPTIGRQWLRGGNVISGQVSATYTLIAADDNQQISCRFTATNANGSTIVISNAIAVTYNAPIVTGSISNVVEDEEDGSSIGGDASSAFNSTPGTYSVSPTGSVLTINTNTGEYSISIDEPLSVTAFHITKTNSGGSDTVDFNITISAASPVIVWPADVSAGLWSVSEVTSQSEADINVGGEECHLKAIWGAITTNPAGFTLKHGLFEGAQQTPLPGYPNVTASSTFYSTVAGTTGQQITPRIYWHHTTSGQMKLAGSKSPITLQGIADQPLPVSTWTRPTTASINTANAAGNESFGTGDTTPQVGGHHGPLKAIVAYNSFSGDTASDAGTVAAIKNCLVGNKAPACNGGFSAQFEASAFMALVVLAKLTPRLWQITKSLSYDAKTQDFVVGRILTGESSGATGTIVEVRPATGTTGSVRLFPYSGNFQDNEAIVGSGSGGSATANGVGAVSQPAFTTDDKARIDILMKTEGKSNMWSSSDQRWNGSTVGRNRTMSGVANNFPRGNSNYQIGHVLSTLCFIAYMGSPSAAISFMGTSAWSWANIRAELQARSLSNPLAGAYASPRPANAPPATEVDNYTGTNWTFSGRGLNDVAGLVTDLLQKSFNLTSFIAHPQSDSLGGRARLLGPSTSELNAWIGMIGMPDEMASSDADGVRSSSVYSYMSIRTIWLMWIIGAASGLIPFNSASANSRKAQVNVGYNWYDKMITVGWADYAKGGSGSGNGNIKRSTHDSDYKFTAHLSMWVDVVADMLGL